MKDSSIKITHYKSSILEERLAVDEDILKMIVNREMSVTTNSKFCQPIKHKPTLCPH